MRALVLLVASLSALAAAQDKPAPGPIVWDVPQPLGAVDVPGPVEAGGLPVTMHAVRSKAPASALLDNFRAQFVRAGLYLPPPRAVQRLTTSAQVTGLDPDRLIAYTVFFQPNPDQTTTVILTETRLEARLRAEAPVQFAALLPAAREVVRSRTEGLELVSYRARATAAEAKAFHLETLGSAGYRETSPGRWERKGEVLKVTVRGEGDAEVAVQLVHGAGPIF